MGKQNAFFIAFLTCFFQIGPIFTMPVAGALCTSSLGWSSVYYLHAIITCILFLLFLYFYREQPQMHAFVSAKELDRIQRNKGSTNEKEPLPVKAIVTSNAIIAVWISAIANFMGIQVTMQFSPIYLNKVMGFPVEQTGLFSAIPQIVTFVLKMFAGVLADKATCCRPVTSVKIFNLWPLEAWELHSLYSPVIPTYVWIVHGVVMSICNVYFMFFGKGEPAEWTKPGYGNRVAPSAPALPALLGTDPKNDQFSMDLNDKISVYVQTTGPSPCDACGGQRGDRTPSPAISDHNVDTGQFFRQKGGLLLLLATLLTR
ncbi:hypothetical protein OSTOST_17408 [Ostertagia ostertagi]